MKQEEQPEDPQYAGGKTEPGRDIGGEVDGPVPQRGHPVLRLLLERLPRRPAENQYHQQVLAIRQPLHHMNIDGVKGDQPHARGHEHGAATIVERKDSPDRHQGQKKDGEFDQPECLKVQEPAQLEVQREGQVA